MERRSLLALVFAGAVLLGIILAFTSSLFRNEGASSSSSEIRASARDAVGDPSGHNDQNRVSNGSFETDLAGWQVQDSPGAFSGYNKESGPQSGVVAVSSDRPDEIEERVVYEARLSQCIPLQNGKRYRFSARFKSESKPGSKHANRVNLGWYQTEDCSGRGEAAHYLEPDYDKQGWQSLSVDGARRALGADSAEIEITQDRRPGNTKRVFWDDIALVPIEWREEQASASEFSGPTPPTGSNYLANGAFGSNLDGWGHTGDTQWSESSGFKDPGAARLAIVSDDGGYGAHSFGQCVNLGKDRRFRAGARARVDSSSTEKGGGIFRLAWYESADCRGRNRAGFSQDRVEDVAGWQQLKLEGIEAPDQASSVRVYFTRGVEDTGTFAYFVDDVFFQSVDHSPES